MISRKKNKVEKPESWHLKMRTEMILHVCNVSKLTLKHLTFRETGARIFEMLVREVFCPRRVLA